MNKFKILLSENIRLEKELESIPDLVKRKDHANRNGRDDWDITEVKWSDPSIYMRPHSPHLWANGAKLEKNCIATTGFMIDIDTPQFKTSNITGVKEPLHVLDLINELRDAHLAFAIIFTTNHQKEKVGVTCDRYRLFFPFDKPVDLTNPKIGNTEYKQMIMNYISKAMRMFDEIDLDDSSYRLDRYFAGGQCADVIEGKPVIWASVDRLWQPIKNKQKAITKQALLKQKVLQLKANSSGNDRTKMYDAMLKKFTKGGLHDATVNLAAACYKNNEDPATIEAIKSKAKALRSDTRAVDKAFEWAKNNIR